MYFNLINAISRHSSNISPNSSYKKNAEVPLKVQRKKNVHLLFKIKTPKRTCVLEQKKNSQKGKKKSAERKNMELKLRHNNEKMSR